MSNFRDARNRAFDAFTPRVLDEPYLKHGRKLANALSLSRIAIAPILFAGSALRLRGRAHGVVRVVKTLTDGYDGFMAEKDQNFATAKPSINTLKQLLGELKNIKKTPRTNGQTAAGAICHLLEETNGAVLDRDTDKVAQVADQAGATISGDMQASSLILTLIRNGFFDSSREMYMGLGIKSAAKAGVWGQYKTLALDTHLALTAFGTLDRTPMAKKMLSYGVMALTAYSAYAGVADMERQYLESSGHCTDDMPNHELFSIGVARTLTANLPNVEISASRFETT